VPARQLARDRCSWLDLASFGYKQHHELTKCATKKSVFFSKIKKSVFLPVFLRKPMLSVLGVLVGSAG
jgi:hypothetical protein